MGQRGERRRRARMQRAVADLEVPPGAWKTCPWQPRTLIETGLRQWFRCAGVALGDGQLIGMPSHAVDEAWHGFILCTTDYARFCHAAYGEFLHHFPDVDPGSPPPDAEVRLNRTIVAWALVAEPGEECVMWDLDARLGLESPWGVRPERVAEVISGLTRPTPRC